MKILILPFILFSFLSFGTSEINSINSLVKLLGYQNYDQVESLTQDELWAIMSYGFTDEVDYKDINGFLRYGESYEMYNLNIISVNKLINDIKSAADKLPLIPKKTELYRGFKLKWRNDKCFTEGEIINDKAFTSTTLNKSTAIHFAFKKEQGPGVLLKLTSTKKLKGILITENNEAEILFMPGRRVLITDSKLIDGKCYASGLID